MRLLAIEGARLDDEPTLFDQAGGLRIEVRPRGKAKANRS
jgi:hypothetical protein